MAISMAKKRQQNKKFSVEALTKKIVAFNEARNWSQFHNFKDLSLSLALEAAEVMEHFQWRAEREMKEYANDHKDAIAEELADCLYWILLTSHYLGVDPLDALDKKVKKNEKRFPIKKAKGKHTNHYGN